MTAPWNQYVGTCDATGKRKYSTRTIAKTVARGMRGGGLHAFRCTHCDTWHLGHKGAWTRAEHRQHHTKEES